MRIGWTALLAPALLAGCLMRSGNYRNVEQAVHQDRAPGPEFETKVFGPVRIEALGEFVRAREASGWEVVELRTASLPEDLMVASSELDQPSAPKRGPWTFDVPKTMDAGFDPPRKPTIPSYLDEDVRNHRQKVLVTMRRWR